MGAPMMSIRSVLLVPSRREQSVLPRLRNSGRAFGPRRLRWDDADFAVAAQESRVPRYGRIFERRLVVLRFPIWPGTATIARYFVVQERSSEPGISEQSISNRCCGDW